MALRILLNRGSAAARHHRRTGLFLTSIGNKTNHQVHQKRDFDIRLTDGKDREGTIYFSNSKSPYTFESVSATIKDHNKQGEILDMAKFAVNEHNNNNHAKGVKPSNLQLERVHEAKLEFNSGATEFHIRLQTLDGGSSRGSGSGGDGWGMVYEATVFKSKTGGLKLGHFELCDPFKEDDPLLHPRVRYGSRKSGFGLKATLCSGTQNQPKHLSYQKNFSMKIH